MSTPRDLGAVERNFHWLAQHGSGHAVAHLTLRGTLDVSRLRLAAERLRAHHEALNVTIGGSLLAPCFVSLPADSPLPLEITASTGPEHWQETLNALLNARADDARAGLWRCLVVQDDAASRHDVFLLLHHAVTDAISLYTLSNELLALYDSAARPEHQIALVPSLETLVRAAYPSRWRWLWLVVRSIFAGMALACRPVRRAPAGAEKDPTARRSVAYEEIVSRELVDRLRERCRTHGTTLNGLYCSAALLACRDLVPAGWLTGTSCGSTVSLRRRLAPTLSDKALGVFVFLMETRHRISAHTELWPLARQFAQRIHKLVARQYPVGWAALVRLVVRSPAQLRLPSRKDGGRMQTVFVSNLGQLPTPHAGTLRLERWAPYVNQHFIGSLVWICAATIDSNASFSFVFTSPLVTPQQARQFITAFIGLLEAAD